jgi:hypothetical protein
MVRLTLGDVAYYWKRSGLVDALSGGCYENVQRAVSFPLRPSTHLIIAEPRGPASRDTHHKP